MSRELGLAVEDVENYTNLPKNVDVSMTIPVFKDGKVSVVRFVLFKLHKDGLVAHFNLLMEKVRAEGYREATDEEIAAAEQARKADAFEKMLRDYQGPMGQA